MDITQLPKEQILELLKAARDEKRLYDAVKYRDELAAKVVRGQHRGDFVECLRWADYTVGILVRQGQQGPDAWISSRGINVRREHRLENKNYGTNIGLVQSGTFFGNHNERGQVFQMTDNVSEQAFAQALERAKAEGSMARAHVIAQLSELPPPSTRAKRPTHLRKTRHVDPKKVIEESLNTLNGVFMGLSVMEPEHWQSLSYSESRKYGDEVGRLVGELRRFRERVTYVSRTTTGAERLGQVGPRQPDEGQPTSST